MKRFAQRVRDFLARPATEAVLSSQAVTQIQLMMSYRRLVAEGHPLPRLADVGFQCHSQTDEDGILLFLFSIIGMGRKLCVEICAGHGMECNTANLILNHGWHGLLVDGDRKNVELGNRFFARSKQSYLYPPRFVCSWVTRGSVNKLLSANGFSGEIDLLSLDLDGVDYWIWESIDEVSPRVVVVEYQNILGPDLSRTVPYADDFRLTDEDPHFWGAALSSYVKLGRRKGYRLVGVNNLGFNAFFVRNGLADSLLPEVAARDCFGQPYATERMRDYLSSTQDLPWVDV